MVTVFPMLLPTLIATLMTVFNARAPISGPHTGNALTKWLPTVAADVFRVHQRSVDYCHAGCFSSLVKEVAEEGEDRYSQSI